MQNGWCLLWIFWTKLNVNRFNSSSEDNGEGEEDLQDMSLPSCPFDPPPVSMCPSETEEAASDHDEDELDDLDEVDEQDNAEEEEEEECECDAEGPSSCWKCVPSTSQAAATSDSAAALSKVAAVPDEDFEAAVSAVITSKSASHVPGENIDEIVQVTCK